jgi:hypothetical protein
MVTFCPGRRSVGTVGVAKLTNAVAQPRHVPHAACPSFGLICVTAKLFPANATVPQSEPQNVVGIPREPRLLAGSQNMPPKL